MTIDIGRDAAHDAAQSELAKPIYPKESLTEQIYDWIEDMLYRLVSKSADVPGGWITVSVIVILVAIAVFVAIRIARRAMRSSRDSSAVLFGEQELSAAEHCATAEQYAAAGNWAAAIRHRVRAMARRLEENGTLDPVPGRTATELARTAGRALPALAVELGSAADAFNDVTYGERPGLESQYRMIAALDDKLASQKASGTGDAQDSAHQAWAEVR